MNTDRGKDAGANVTSSGNKYGGGGGRGGCAIVRFEFHDRDEVTKGLGGSINRDRVSYLRLLALTLHGYAAAIRSS